MNRITLGVVVGGALGVLDGLSAWFYPEARAQLAGIVIGSTLKGVIAGLLIGLFARKVTGIGWTVVFGAVVGAVLAFLVAAMQGKNYLEITLPGTLVGLLTGFATMRYGRPAASPAR